MESVSQTSAQARNPVPADARRDYTTMYLVRHGETEWNTQDILQGHLDSALTARGVQQARALVERFKDIHFDGIFSSDVARARRTAEILALERELMVGTTQLLRERNWGRYDGKAARLYREENRELIERYKNLTQDEQWSFKMFDDIESFAEIFTRFITFLREAAVAYCGRTLLVVTHRDVLETLLIKLGYAPRSIDNTAWVRLLSDGTDMVVDAMEGIVT